MSLQNSRHWASQFCFFGAKWQDPLTGFLIIFLQLGMRYVLEDFPIFLLVLLPPFLYFEN